jgi:hypothetical protein
MSERVRRYIAFNEGTRNEVYLDHLGNRTIGVGFNLERPGAERKITALGLDFHEVLNGRASLWPDQIDALLDADIEAARQAAQRLIPDFDDLAGDRAIVVIDMIFQPGGSWFRKVPQLYCGHQCGGLGARGG